MRCIEAAIVPVDPEEPMTSLTSDIDTGWPVTDCTTHSYWPLVIQEW